MQIEENKVEKELNKIGGGAPELELGPELGRLDGLSVEGDGPGAM
jgi:hypothetical protein